VILGKSIIEICKKIEADVGEAVVEDWQNSLTVQPEIYGSDPNRHIYDFISENMTEVTQFTSVYETGKISINRVLRSLSGIQHEIDRLIGENIAVVGEDVPVVESEDALPDRPLLIYRNLRSHIEHTDLNSSDSPTRMPTFWSLARHQKYWDRGMKVQETEQPSAEDSAILSNDTLAELDAKMQALSDLIDLTISAQTCIHESQTNLTPEHISANEKARPYDSTDESYDELDQSIDAVPSRKSQDVGNRPQSSRIDLGLSNPLEHGIRPATDNASMKAFNHMAGTASIDQDDLEKQEGKKAQNIDEAQKPMPLFLPIEVYKTLEDLSTKMKSLTNFLDEMISVQKVPQESREEKNSETSKATNDEETLSSSHQLKNRRARRSQSASVSKRCMQSRFKSVRRLKTPLSGREKKCSDALVEDKGRATEDGIHSLKLKFHYPVTRPFRGDLEYEELEQILNGVELPKHRDSRKGMQEAIREAWLSLEAKSKPYPFLDHELTHKFFMEWLSEPDQQHGLKVDTNNRMSSQSGTGHGLGAVYDEVESEIDNAESKWTSASMGRLNIQASPRLFSPHLSLSEIPDDMEPPYPTLSIPGEEETAMAPSHDGQSIDTYTPERASPLDDEPFCTPLGFHIPQNKLQEALDAPTTSTAAYWQYTRKHPF